MLIEKVSYMYNKFIKDGNITYSIDKIRLKTYITYSTFSEIEFRFNTVWKEYVKKNYTTGRISNYKYNYDIEIADNKSFFFGYFHNTEKPSFWDSRKKYSFYIEFNPNKIKDDKILMYLLSKSVDWYIRSYDLAVDIETSILNLIVDKSGKRLLHTISGGGDNLTYMSGKGDGRFKIYNKKKESNLQMRGELTRIEVSRLIEEYSILDLERYQYNEVFPEIYLNNYMMTTDDYGSETLLAILYAVQNGYPISSLSRKYKNKIESMFKGGYKIEFSSDLAKNILKETIYFYFKNNPRILWK